MPKQTGRIYDALRANWRTTVKADQSPCKPEHCLNCQASVTGNFCKQCGQENRDQNVSIQVLTSDFIQDYFTFDSKLFRSIVPFLIKPGFLTNEFNAGRRTKYVSPLRLFLFVSIVAFFIFSVNLNKMVISDDVEVDKVGDALVINGSNRGASPRSGNDEPVSGFSRAMDEIVVKIEPGIDNFFAQKAKQFKKMGLASFIKKFLVDFEENISKAMFLLIPVFALLLKLLYIRSKRFYVEHLIFSLHFHTFALIILLLAALLNSPTANVLAPLMIGIYLYIAMREVFKQPCFKTLVKFSLLSSVYGVVVFFVLLGLSLATVALL